MKIYHYTSLENLALILKHKTIRFNRLDRMEDPCENMNEGLAILAKALLNKYVPNAKLIFSELGENPLWYLV